MLVFVSVMKTRRMFGNAFFFFTSARANIMRTCSDVAKIEAGIGDKVGSFLQFMSMCVCGFIIGFIKGWKVLKNANMCCMNRCPSVLCNYLQA
jgi:hypothetical protein